MTTNAVAGPSRLVTAARPTSRPSSSSPSKSDHNDLRASSGWGWKGAMDAVKIGATFGFWGPSDREASSEATSSPRVQSPQARQSLRPVEIPRPSPAPPRVCDSAARARLEQALSHGRLVRSLPPDKPDDPSISTSSCPGPLAPARVEVAPHLADTTLDDPPAYHTLPRRRPSDEEWEEFTAEASRLLAKEDAHLVTPSTSRYSTYRSSSPSRRFGTKKPPRPTRRIVHLPMPRWTSEDEDEDEDDSDEEDLGNTDEREGRTNRRLDSLSRRMQRLIVQGQRALASRAEDLDEDWPVRDGRSGMVGAYHMSPRKKTRMGEAKRMMRPASHGVLKGSVRGRPRMPVRAKSLLAIGVEA